MERAGRLRRPGRTRRDSSDSAPGRRAGWRPSDAGSQVPVCRGSPGQVDERPIAGRDRACRYYSFNPKNR